MNAVDRRTFVGGIGAGLLGSPALAASAKSKPGRPPNVVFIMADDLGFADLSCTGSRHIKTPAIDSISAGGVHLRQGYSSTPICSPTRTALLTGRYAQRLAVGLEEPIGPSVPKGTGVPLDMPTLPGVFKARGYQSWARMAATFGKKTVEALNTPGCGAAKPSGGAYG